MKKIVFLLAVVLLAGLTTKSVAQKDRRLSNGLSLNVYMGLPSSNYGFDKDGGIGGMKLSDDYGPGMMGGFKIGNRWYFSPNEKFGFGLMVNWADISIAANTGTDTGTDWTRAIIDFSFLEVGPIGTYALGDNTALDAYYNLKPTVLASGLVFNGSGSNSSDETLAFAGTGMSHVLGTAFRYKVFNVGLEYVFGSIKSSGTYDDGSGSTDLDDQKNKVNNLRLVFGFKF
jgi:hypothetical protein